MIDERKEETAALYVFGVLEQGEARAFEQEMSADGELRTFVDELMRHTATLAHAAPQKAAPPHLKERILENIKRGGAGAEDIPGGKVVPFRISQVILPWTMAACFAVIAGVLVVDRTKLKSELADLQTRNDVCQMQVAMLDSMNGKPRQGLAVVIWDPSTQTGVLKGEDMPRPAANEDYQLWVVDPKYPQPVNAGVFNVDGNGSTKAMFKPSLPVSASGKFAVSIERKGGAAQHEGPIVMLSK
jgi:anti-sigma-K factor RskA